MVEDEDPASAMETTDGQVDNVDRSSLIDAALPWFLPQLEKQAMVEDLDL